MSGHGHAFALKTSASMVEDDRERERMWHSSMNN